MQTDLNVYWATLPEDELVSVLESKVREFYRYLEASGRLDKMHRSYQAYYGQGADRSSNQLTAGGVAGELTLLKANEYRNLVSHLHVLTTSSRPALECRAVNSDYSSETQTILGNGLLEYYMRERRMERSLKNACEKALVLDSAWLVTEWDPTLGKEIAVDSSGMEADESGGGVQSVARTIKEGDIKYRDKTPLEVIIDPTLRQGEERDWVIIRDRQNKYDLAAQRSEDPELQQRIVSTGSNPEEDRKFILGYVLPTQQLQSVEVDVFTFYHDRTPSLPEGRQVIFLRGGICLYNGPLPYKKLPASRIAAGEMIMSALGYSPASDLLSLQDVVDSAMSAMTTNLVNLGVNNLWAKPGHNLNVTQIVDGMNLLESETKPEVLIMNRVPPEMFNFVDLLIRRMETYSGINSTARGTPPSGDMSGAALALLQSMAIQFSSGLQSSYAQLAEDVGSLTISHLQRFAQSKRVAMIAGKANSYMMAEFSSGDIDSIERVYVDLANPLSRTTSGRLQIADSLLQKGLIKDPEQYLMVLETGRLEPLIEGQRSELLTIRAENEMISRGERPLAMATDDHVAHIRGHKVTVANPVSRQDPDVVRAQTEHSLEHIRLLKETSPELLKILGMEPLQPTQAPGPSDALNATPPQVQEAQEVNPPQFPSNPLTGQQWNPETGGL